MKLGLFAVLLLTGKSFASEGQGIDEEKIYPDWETTDVGEISLFTEHIEPTAILKDWESKSIEAVQNNEVVIKLNKGVDKVLEFLRQAFSSFGDVGIPLPDITKEFGHPPYSGNFSASQGYFKNPATLERTGDVEIKVESGTTLILQVELGFKVAEAGFGLYHLDILNIHNQGTITASVNQNSVILGLTLTYNPPLCKFNLDELKFDKLNGIKIDITGLGIFQTMFNELSHWLTSNFESTFRDVINKKMYETANKALINKDICKYFPH